MYEIKVIEDASFKIAEIISEAIVIKSEQDALDMMANTRYEGCDDIIINEKNLPAEFFDLSTRLAGEILQKFSNYHMRLAIVGDFRKYTSDSLRRFIQESNKGNQIFFVKDNAEAVNLFDQRQFYSSDQN